jgi:hypothetical protein
MQIGETIPTAKTWGCFNVSRKGYSHIKSKVECQDASASYLGNGKGYVAVADGHGAARYFRSSLGSKFAIEAFQNICKALNKRKGHLTIDEDSIKRAFISQWDRLVEKHFSHHHFSEKELGRLTEGKDRQRVTECFYYAYGTNFHGFAFGDGYCFALSIGDGGLAIIKNDGTFENPFEEFDDENVANYTCSLCDEESATYLHFKTFDMQSIDVVALATDGTMNPFRTFSNYAIAMVTPFQNVSKDKYPCLRHDCRLFVSELADKKGLGDDCSLAVLNRIKERSDSMNTVEAH